MVLFCALFSVAVNAQNMFNKGDKVIQAGIGLGNTFSGYSSMIPLAASFEVGIKDNLFDDKSSLGIGGYFGFASKNHWTFLYPGVRGALHYQFVENLDTYAGLMIGMRLWTWSYGGSSSSYSDIIIPFFIGARYYFQPKMAVFGELGHGIAYLTVGVALKL